MRAKKHLQKLFEEYSHRLMEYECLSLASKAETRRAELAGNETEAEYYRSEMRRLYDLRQLCVQIIDDLESFVLKNIKILE